MNGQRKLVCSGCGRHRSRSFLQEVKGKVGLYCAVCRKPVPKVQRMVEQARFGKGF